MDFRALEELGFFFFFFNLSGVDPFKTLTGMDSLWKLERVGGSVAQ